VTKQIVSTLPEVRDLGMRDTSEFIAIAHEVREALHAGHGADGDEG